MSSKIRLQWHSYKYFPYEKVLARREIEALFGAAPVETPEGLSVDVPRGETASIESLTYVRLGTSANGATVIPQQARLENSAVGNSERVDCAPTLRRQQTRYSAHGLHDYRGKFNPQIVRAIGNMFSLTSRTWVLDPFCGSGTTLLECAHTGWNAVGVDANPLAVLIANAKIGALREVDHGLRDCLLGVFGRIRERAHEITQGNAISAAALSRCAGRAWQSRLSNADYLVRWFPAAVLAQIAIALEEIGKIEREKQADVALALLSDALREVSYQDPGDLRIRRRSDPAPNYPLAVLLHSRAAERIDRIERARKHVKFGRSSQRALLGDSRQLLGAGTRRPKALQRRFAAVITSPPYANALPYIDTQRLSLCVLGLVSADELRASEGGMIGNREISRTDRDDAIVDIRRNSAQMPAAVSELCKEMLAASLDQGNGFRRRNTPSLIYRYFLDMRRVLRGIQERLVVGGPIGLVVGRNRTILGGQEFVVDTPVLLAEIGQTVGLHFDELVELDTYQRYALHVRNSIRNEALLILRR